MNIPDYRVLLSSTSSKRSFFDAQPIFIKIGLVHYQKLRSLRRQQFSQRFVQAELFKERGNRFFQLGLYQQGSYEYELSLAVFTYIEPKNTKVKPLEMKNEDFVFQDYKGVNENEVEDLKNLRLKLYLNLAACYLRLGQHVDSVKACDLALVLDPYSVKAYYRRAKARLINLNASEKDYEMAIVDLQNASLLDQNDQDIMRELVKIQNDLKEIRRIDLMRKKNQIPPQQPQQVEQDHVQITKNTKGNKKSSQNQQQSQPSNPNLKQKQDQNQTQNQSFNQSQSFQKQNQIDSRSNYNMNVDQIQFTSTNQKNQNQNINYNFSYNQQYSQLQNQGQPTDLKDNKYQYSNLNQSNKQDQRSNINQKNQYPIQNNNQIQNQGQAFSFNQDQNQNIYQRQPNEKFNVNPTQAVQQTFQQGSNKQPDNLKKSQLQQQQEQLIEQFSRQQFQQEDSYTDEDYESQFEGDQGSICSSESDQANKQAQEFWKQFNIHKDYDTFNYELSYEEDPHKPIPIEVKELGKFIETRGIEILKLYETSGRKKEAEELKDKLKKALAAKKQLEKISQLDFNKPKKKLQEIADNFGIDLYDPQVQEEFKKIQEQNLEDIRQWLKQNQWNYSSSTQSTNIPVGPSTINQILDQPMFMKSKKRPKGQARHKSKFNKRRSDAPPQRPVQILNKVIYNQTFNNGKNIQNYTENTQVYQNNPSNQHDYN